MALLMAIFQYQPSPFCILDEVDAPLDEPTSGAHAPAARDVRQTSSSSSPLQADHGSRPSLYGVTMQEPGVSQTGAVKFDTPAVSVAGGGGSIEETPDRGTKREY